LQVGQKAKTADASEVDLCSVLRDPAAFFGHVIKLRAFVDSDLVERTMLHQDGCSTQGIALSTSKTENRPMTLMEDVEYQRYRKLWRQIPQLADKQQRVQGVFEGMFLQRSDRAPTGILILHRVSDLEIKTKGAPRAEQ
jgi:hypothetical protein